jgi:flavin-dependent dehydrogenase
MIHPAHIQPDIELRDYLKGKVVVGNPPTAQAVTVYADWERPTNELPTDFIVIFINGDIGGVGMDTPFARGYLMVSLYCKLNDDGSVKKSRVSKILEQFDTLLEKQLTENYHFEYDAERYITPTTPNQSSGYSVTTLNLRWTTTSNINK